MGHLLLPLLEPGLRKEEKEGRVEREEAACLGGCPTSQVQQPQVLKKALASRSRPLA